MFATKCILYLLMYTAKSEVIIEVPDEIIERQRYESVEVNDARLRKSRRKFSVVWNVPSTQCTSASVDLGNLTEKYGITQNSKNTFRGDRISLLYDPGFFPALLRNGTQKELFYRNGGVPQEGNLTKHLELFEKSLNQQIPDENFNGIGIIDFESWKPIFRQNFGGQKVYIDVSVQIEGKKHPLWPRSWQQKEAERRLEESGRKFMESTVALAKKLRPKAEWSFYAYPYCYNMGETHKQSACPDKVKEENDRMHWLWDEATALFPSVYFPKRLNAVERVQMVKGRIQESKRMNRRIDIYPYTWYKFLDDKDTYITKDDFENMMKAIYNAGSAGAIIWGSSSDVNTKTKCIKLKEYVDKVIGPISKKYTQDFTSSKLLKSATKNRRTFFQSLVKIELGDDSIMNTELCCLLNKF